MVERIQLEDAASPLARLFGQRLRARRMALQLTQVMLFEQTGVAASYISLIERGRSNPSLDIIEALSRAVGSSVSEMLRDETDEKTP
jgi:transcriptional regulator with XRE-family HTH domain